MVRYFSSWTNSFDWDCSCRVAVEPCEPLIHGRRSEVAHCGHSRSASLSNTQAESRLSAAMTFGREGEPRLCSVEGSRGMSTLRRSTRRVSVHSPTWPSLRRARCRPLLGCRKSCPRLWRRGHRPRHGRRSFWYRSVLRVRFVTAMAFVPLFQAMSRCSSPKHRAAPNRDKRYLATRDPVPDRLRSKPERARKILNSHQIKVFKERLGSCRTRAIAVEHTSRPLPFLGSEV